MLRLWAIALLLTAGCFSADIVKQRGARNNSCLPDGGCADQLVCSGGKCLQACASTSECQKSEVCGGGLCLTNVLGAGCDPECSAGLTCISGRCLCVEGADCAGCCLAEACVANVNAQNCGVGGSLCNTCSGLTPTCESGACTAACDPNTLCTGGCCTSNACQTGSDVATCGTNGSACVDCNTSPQGFACKSDGSCGCATQADCAPLHSCVQGVCSLTCSPSAPCRDGCCNAAGVCQSGVNDAACGAIGGACQDCASGTNKDGRFCDPATRACGCNDSNAASACAELSSGKICVGGFCGCTQPTGPSGCQGGFTCTTAAGRGQCTALPCDGVGNDCVGSCCNNGFCAESHPSATCGTNGAACFDCTGNSQGSACVTGACGCNVDADCASASGGRKTCDVSTHACVVCVDQSDCPAQQACDLTAHVCSSTCGSGFSPCSTGCCTSGNVCVAGTINTVCGNDGASCDTCASDTTPRSGLPCDAGNPCTCDDTSPAGISGSTGNTGGICSHTGCDDTDTCQSGVCDGGTCVQNCPGNTVLITTTNPDHCGCNSEANCPVGERCNTILKICTGVGACTAGQICNGCCSGGQCRVGTANGACGVSGLTGNANCTDCGASPQGDICVSASGLHCGCNNSIDCPAGQACNTTTHTCTTACNGAQFCNGGCCSGGICRPGTENDACGSGGGACGPNCTTETTCSDTTRTCVNTGCNGANPCVLSECDIDAGQVTGTCRASCSSGTNGSVFFNTFDAMPNPQHCGCNVAADCPQGSICRLAAGSTKNYCMAGTACTLGACNGCCALANSNLCVKGTSNQLCGGTGSACVPCSGTNACSDARTCVQGCNDATPCASGICDANQGETVGLCRASCAASRNGLQHLTTTNPDHCACANQTQCSVGTCDTTPGVLYCE